MKKKVTEIPNIIFDMLEFGIITRPDFILYSVCKRIADEFGCDRYNFRELAKKCDLSAPTVTKSKRKLQSKFACLGGKSLITIERSISRPDAITITDLSGITRIDKKHRLNAPGCDKT